MPVFGRILDALGRGERAALVTVVAARGSSPREAGVRMVVTADGFSGTIGGGALEWAALARAETVLAAARPGPATVFEQALGPDLGQCCGGRVSLLLEVFSPEDRRHVTELAAAEKQGPFSTEGRVGGTPFITRRILSARPTPAARPNPEARASRPDSSAGPEAGSGPAVAYDRATGLLRETFTDPRTPVLLFGAGHVGRALVLALAPLPFAVTWVDSRPGAFPRHLPDNVEPVFSPDPAAALAGAAAGAVVLVMTHSHALDLALVAAALPDGRRFPFVGLIGSATKRARFEQRLRRAGIDPARLVCPIGLPEIAGKEPAVIAAGVAAQLLIQRSRAVTLAPSLEPALA